MQVVSSEGFFLYKIWLNLDDENVMELKVPPPIVAILVGVIMWQSTGFTSEVLLLNFEYKFIVCVVLACSGLAIDLVALWGFMRARTTVNPIKPTNASTLVTSGIYRVTRNPMYVGNFIFLVAWLVWLGEPLNAMFLILYVLYMNKFQIEPEERVLTEKFGEEYQLFCQRVRRWI